MISACGWEAMLKGQSYHRQLELGTEHDVLGYCDKKIRGPSIDQKMIADKL